MSGSRVLVLGGGISGLATAWWLSRRGIPVEVWESDTVPGGKIRSIREDGYLSERAAGMLVNFLPEIDVLLQETGLDNLREMRPSDLKRYVLHHGRLSSVPMSLAGISLSPLWSWRTKVRMLVEGLIPSGGDDQESVSAFVSRRFGSGILETTFDPFVSGTLAADPDLACARAVLPRLTSLESRYGSITAGVLINGVLRRRRANKADVFSFKGGMGALIDQLSSTPGIDLRCGVRATGIAREKGSWGVTGASGSSVLHRTLPQLVISLPSFHAAELLHDVDMLLASQLRGIEYAPLAVVHLGLRKEHVNHPIDGSGFLTGYREPIGLNGNIWMSSLFPGRAPAGQILMTSYLGGARHPGRVELADQSLMETVLADLAPLLAIRGEPEYMRVERHQSALPLYHGDYIGRTDRIHNRLAGLPGLHLCTNYLGGVSVRDRIQQGMLTATRIAYQLGHGSEPTTALDRLRPLPIEPCA